MDETHWFQFGSSPANTTDVFAQKGHLGHTSIAEARRPGAAACEARAGGQRSLEAKLAMLLWHHVFPCFFSFGQNTVDEIVHH